MKNINSFSSVKEAIEYEIKRQNEALDKGKKIIQETRRFDAEELKTYSMREKVDAVDYKYFIEPNIPPVKLTKEFLSDIRKEIPKLQYERYHQYTSEYELSEYDANVLVKDKEIADYFEELIGYGIKPKEACSWVTTVILGSLNKLNTDLKGLFITSKMLSEVVKLTLDNKISVGNAKKILYRAMDERIDPLTIIENENLRQIDDENVLIKLVNESLDEHEDIVLQFKEGKDYVVNYFVGQIMKKTKGQASPTKTLEIIKKEIKKR